MKIAAIALNTFRQAVRNRILYSLLLFAFLLVGISAFFGTVSIGDQARVIKNFGLFAISFFGAIITMLAGVNLLHQELKQKTVYNILSKPLWRWQYILGKFIGLTLTIQSLAALMGLALTAFVWFFEKKLDLLLFQALFFTLLEMMIIAALVIFFSALAVTVTLSGIFTFCAYLAGRSINYLSFFTEQQNDISPALKKLIVLMNWILPDLSVFNLADSLVYGHSASIGYAANALVYAAGYSSCVLALAAVIFSRRELS